MQRHITQKDGASITPAHAKVKTKRRGSRTALAPCALKVGSHSFPFSAQFFDFSIPARPQEGAGVDTPSGSSANNLNILSHG